MSVLTLPATLWNLYVDYLWNYKPNSWVSSAASTFRVLAVLCIVPFAILTLLVRMLSYVVRLDTHKNFQDALSCRDLSELIGIGLMRWCRMEIRMI